MYEIISSFPRDANRVPIDNLGIIVRKTIAYDGTSSKGLAGSNDIFTVTGDVAVKILAVCSDDLTVDGAATIEIGITGNTAALIAQTTASNIDKGEIWYDNTPVTVGSLAMGTWNFLSGTSIKEKITTANITGGALTYYLFFVPLSADGNVLAV